jgi:hypothetical protein
MAWQREGDAVKDRFLDGREVEGCPGTCAVVN